MNPRRKPWYKTKWGFIFALVASPFWFIWKKTRRNRLLRVIVGCIYAAIASVVIILLVGHLFSSKAVKGNDAAASSNATSGNTAVALQGYGATLSEWNNSHSEDSSFASNTSYDPTSGLGNGYNDKYTSVLWINGRALAYQIGFPDNTGIASAVSTALQEFPSDASILWQQENTSDPSNECYQIEIHSTTLGQALESDGDAFVEFQTVETSDTSTADGYYANNVNEASLRNADYKATNQADGC